ncbi:MAG: YARHG domain-containing protein [Candidatus Symbiothrix sp.]|jgi:hypothetical protein|nr:YARHG domain-containing protein [Candidatus Symbiothrix sp.]
MLTTQEIEKYQKAVQGIDTAQNALSPEEQQAFAALKTIFSTGNYAATEGGIYINVLKNGLARHGNNRLLQVYLKNFLEICNKCFKGTGGSTQTENSNPPAEKKKGGNNTLIMVIIIAVVGWFVYKNWDSVSEFFGLNSEKVESQTKILETTSPPNELAVLETNTVDVVPKVEEITPQPPVNQDNENSSSDYQLSIRLLTESDLYGLSKAQLRILRNEIYARHGRRFKSADLQEYFSRQSWYQPLYDEVSLTNIELKNVEFIRQHEKYK